MAGNFFWKTPDFNAIVIDDSAIAGNNSLTTLAAGSAALTGTTNFNGSPGAKPTSIDNSATGFQDFYLDLMVKLIFGVAPTAGKTVDFYILYSLDGTNYGGGTAGASPTTVATQFIGSVPLVNATTQPLMTITRVPICPYKFQIQVVNSADQALGAQNAGSAITASVYTQRYT